MKNFRRRKSEKLFLVAFYECDEDYELENVEQDRFTAAAKGGLAALPDVWRLMKMRTEMKKRCVEYYKLH